jgi:hypothetical protein
MHLNLSNYLEIPAQMSFQNTNLLLLITVEVSICNAGGLSFESMRAMGQKNPLNVNFKASKSAEEVGTVRAI